MLELMLRLSTSVDAGAYASVEHLIGRGSQESSVLDTATSRYRTSVDAGAFASVEHLIGRGSQESSVLDTATPRCRTLVDAELLLRWRVNSIRLTAWQTAAEAQPNPTVQQHHDAAPR
jgi:hypothetical protein